MVGGTTYAGKANVTNSTVSYSGGIVGAYGLSMPGILNTSNVTGSFSGLSTATATNSTNVPKLHSECRHGGVRRIGLSGTIIVGTTTVIVSPTDLVTGSPSQGQFVVINQTPGGLGGVGMVYGPATPPRGVGSLQLNVTASTDHWSVYNYDHIGTPLADITALGYSTYTDNNTTAPILQMEINPGNTTAPDAGVTYSTLNFEPYLQSGGVTPNSWQRWNVLTGKVWGTYLLQGAPSSSPITWSTFLARYPHATIKRGFGIDVGSGWSSMTGEADALVIGTGQSTLYDFEPVGPIAPPTVRITTSSLPPAVAKTLYSVTLTASGGNPPYQWSESGLPIGLYLKGRTGLIVGRLPNSDTGKTFIFTVQVHDHKIAKIPQNTAIKMLTLTVH